MVVFERTERMKSYQTICQLMAYCYLFQLTAGLPFSFPESGQSSSGRGASTRENLSSRAASSRSDTGSSRQEAFEGRSIRGQQPSGNRYQFPDIYSRYQVHEDDPDPPGVVNRRTTLGPFLQRPALSSSSSGGITPPPPLYTTRSDRPNAAFNRLPPVKNDEPIQAEASDDYEGDDDDDDDVGEEGQPDKPVTASAALYNPSSGIQRPGTSSSSSSNTVNNLFYGFGDKFGGLFGENRHKFKYKRRKPGQPCIPYSLFHKLKYGRDLQGNPVDPKTLLPNLNLILADLNYYAPNNNLYGGGDHASDAVGGGGALFNNHFYDAVGGYPCQGVNFGGGNKPFQPFKPHRPHGGPLGFFGQGGLFDWVSSADAVQADEGVGDGTPSGNRPTVVFNLNDAIDTVATNWRPGESFQKVMGVIADFITQVAGGAVAPVADVATDVRTINREFFSLFG
ncbi:uncharacterized protein LOC126571677 [Anopheles aquasalis]|uniref:uncharacterized protein LOC126571677 n=1 Tax=Anopheles aquasalis TaxID=42839 RepID=UPI00215A4B36|nr:uncharacterized protein LOC126571677 [Anopheles aquasalis]